jgi:hypothetical protein
MEAEDIRRAMRGRRGFGMLRRASRPPMGARGYVIEPGDMRMHSAPDLAMRYGYPAPEPEGRAPAMGMGSPRMAPPRMSPQPYAFQPQRVPTHGPHAQTPVVVQQPQARRPIRGPGVNEIPMGAYTAGVAPPRAPPVRANTEPPPTSARLNRRQSAPNSKPVGPSGQEWIQGDPFLDACTCTTNCTCRKGQRVLYRSQAQDGDGHNGWGEIRYVLKDDLGRDCGDHSKCHAQHDSDSDDGKSKTKKKGKGKKDKNGKDVDDFNEEMRQRLKAMQEDLAGMKLQDRSARPGMPPPSPYGPMPPRNGPPPGMMDGMDPRMPVDFGGAPFGMGGPSRPPPGMGGMMGGRPDRMRRMGGPGPDPPMPPPGMGFNEDPPYSESAFDMDDMMGMPRPPRPRMGRGGRRPVPLDMMGAPSPRQGRGRGGPRGTPLQDMEAGMGEFGRGPPPPPMRGRGWRPRGAGPPRRRPAPLPRDFNEESVDMIARAGRGGGFRDGYGDEYEEEEPWEDLDGTAP